MHCKGEAQKNPLFWRFSGGFCFSQDRLLSRNSTRKPLNLIKSSIFTNAPCKTTCLYNAPSMHTVDFFPVPLPPSPFGFRRFNMTVGFLYGAGAETLIFVRGTSGQKSETFRLPAEKPKSAVDTQNLVAHPCGDPNRATQCRAQSVASNSRRIRDVAPKSRYTPPNQGVAPFSGPPCRTFLSFAAGRGRGGLAEGIAALLGSENGSRYRGGIAATVTPVALLCATKTQKTKKNRCLGIRC